MEAGGILMAITRRKSAEKYITNPSAKLVRETLDNSTIRTWNPSKNYQKCAMIVSNKTCQGGAGVNTYHSSYFLMEGQKRFTVAGYQTSINTAGYSDQEALAVEPVLVQISPPLAFDEYFVNACQGYASIYAVTNKGNVYSGGQNDHGNLGHNDATNRFVLLKVTSTAGGVQFGPGAVQAVKVFSNGGPTTGTKTTYVIDSEGKIYGTGRNANNELGDGTTTQRNAFQRIGTLENITTIATNNYNAFALRKDGNLYCWGYNGQGQLGVGDTANRTTPTLTNTGVVKIITTDNTGNNGTSHLIKADGTVWVTGYSGGNGLTGLGNATQQTSWQQVTINLSNRNVVDIISQGGGGDSRSFWALIDDGSIYSWGYNGYGQLGHSGTSNVGSPNLLVQPTGFPKVDKIVGFGAASEYGFKAINMASGRMFTVGNWCNGAIGISKDDASGTWPLETPTTNRAHYPAREVESPQPVLQGYATIKDVVTLIAENSDRTAVFCLLSDGTVWAKGGNVRGELGTKQVMNFYSDGTNPQSVQHGNLRWNPTWQQVQF
jgi:alpha-tubulin suppressor-like RCC1 family protein